MRHLADRAMLGLVAKFVGMEMESLRGDSYADQQQTHQHGRAPGRCQAFGIDPVRFERPDSLGLAASKPALRIFRGPAHLSLTLAERRPPAPPCGRAQG